MKNQSQIDQVATQLVKSGESYAIAKRIFLKAFILAALTANHGNICLTARELEMHRNTLTRTIEELFDPGEFYALRYKLGWQRTAYKGIRVQSIRQTSQLAEARA